MFVGQWFKCPWAQIILLLWASTFYFCSVLLRIKEGIKGNTEKTALAMEAQKEAGGGGGGGGGDAEGEDGPADTGDDLSNLAALA